MAPGRQEARTRLIQASVVLAAWSVAGTAGVARPAPAAVPRELVEFRIPVVHATLENGLRIVVSEDHAAPVVAVNVMYRAGTRVETPGRSGLAHYFEHLMFQGTRALDRDEYARAITGLGGRYNGATRVDYANYYTVAPANALDLLLWIEADRMQGLELTPQAVENQRAVVIEEVRQSLNQPATGVDGGLEFNRLAFGKWQNAHDGYGDLADLQSATLDDFVAFYRRFYVPANAVLVVAGDCRAADVISKARTYFGKLPARPAPEFADVRETVPGQAERSVVVQDGRARGPVLTVGYRLPPRGTRALAALSVLQTLLTRDPRGLLVRALVDDTRVATSVSASFHALGNDFDFDGPMLYTIRADLSAGRTAAEALAVIDRVIARIQRGVTAGELADSRLRFATWFLDQVAGPGNPYATRAKMLAAFTLFDGTPHGVNRILPGALSLSAEDLQAIARTYLVPSNRVWLERRPR